MLIYTPSKITIKAVQNDQSIECKVEAIVAEGTGLAYSEQQSCEGETVFTLTHVPTGMRVGGMWQVSTEQEARAWIEQLHEIIDWTKDRPCVRAEMKGKVVYLAIIGALHEIEEEEDAG